MQDRIQRSISATSSVCFAALVLLCAGVLADKPDREEKRVKVDQQREVLRKKIEQVRQATGNRMLRATTLVDLYKDLFLLDYDDPRTALGAAVAMRDVPVEQLV